MPDFEISEVLSTLKKAEESDLPYLLFVGAPDGFITYGNADFDSVDSPFSTYCADRLFNAFPHLVVLPLSDSGEENPNKITTPLSEEVYALLVKHKAEFRKLSISENIVLTNHSVAKSFCLEVVLIKPQAKTIHLSAYGKLALLDSLQTKLINLRK